MGLYDSVTPVTAMNGELDGSGMSIEVTTTRFGDGVIAEVGAVLDERGIERPLVVSDDGVAAAGILDTALDSVTGEMTRLWATTEPSVSDFSDLPDDEIDGIVAIGGGSCLDTAKVAALLLAHGGSPQDYIGEGTVPGPVAPIIAVPTTSGTGSQATQSAVVSFDGVKRGISDEVLRPDVAIVDPGVTGGLPPAITARSGFDAFVHALESLLAKDYRAVPERPIRYQGANPITRPLSRHALDLVHGSLETAVEAGEEMTARREMSLGSHLAGVAFSNAGLGAVHALASTVGGLTDRPHGECLGASIEVGLAFNRPVLEDQYAGIARALGIASTQTSDTDAADALQDECLRIADRIGLPTTFPDVGLGPDDIEIIVDNTLIQDRRLVTNPREVTAEALRRTVSAAFA